MVKKASNIQRTSEERYDSMKAYRDIKNSIDTALERGREEGLQEGMEKGRKEGMEKGREERETEIARNLLGMGMSVEQVSKATGLSTDFLKSIS